MQEIQRFVNRLAENIERVIVGKRAAIDLLMVALLCEGHVLLEDVPGVGKTMLARALAVSLGGQFKRLQCTPDLLPNDVTGVSVFNQQSRDFEFRPGPIFVNVLLAGISIGYPALADEKALLIHLQYEHPINALSPVVDGSKLSKYQKLVWDI